MLLKVLEEVWWAFDPVVVVDMALIWLTYAADLFGPEEALRALREGGVVVALRPRTKLITWSSSAFTMPGVLRKRVRRVVGSIREGAVRRKTWFNVPSMAPTTVQVCN